MLFFLPLILLPTTVFTKPITPQAANAGAALTNIQTNGKLSTEGKTTFDGVNLAAIPAKPSVAQVVAGAITRTGWTATADSEQAGNPASNVLDGDTTTFWHTEYNPALAQLPHTITINMQQSYLVGSVTYLPRQDGPNGNIGQHIISLR